KKNLSVINHRKAFNMTSTITREQWLSKATEELRALFKQHGEVIPERVRSSCGFPSKSALSAKNRRIGECWSSRASADSHAEIFISPTISDSSRVLDILAHELIHAIHPGDGHGSKFGRTARAIGLEGKLTATVAGPEFLAWAEPVLARLGVYPHADLVPANAIKKRPDLELYQPDKRHPTLAGTYLAATTAYAALYGKSPVGNTYTAGLDAATAGFLQTVALETVQEYLGR
ncbi:MAG: hypothetical protein EBT83_05300, partial [Betaproteobacteria bacterium]|nr:hypothetical protein [Betaproteobacteria bacterium]